MTLLVLDASGDLTRSLLLPRLGSVLGRNRTGPNDIDALAGVHWPRCRDDLAAAAAVGEDAQFGPGGDVPVQLVEPGDLPLVHVSLMDAFGSVVPVEPVVADHNESGYRPHVTVVDGRWLKRDALSGVPRPYSVLSVDCPSPTIA